jgi:methylthioribose-1-phosphate isomerase
VHVPSICGTRRGVLQWDDLHGANRASSRHPAVHVPRGLVAWGSDGIASTMDSLSAPPRPLTRPRGARCIDIIDQTRLPHELVHVRLSTPEAVAGAISGMLLRGAPLIGAAAAYGVALAADVDASDAALAAACDRLLRTRPTAVNLRWALDRVRATIGSLPLSARADAAWAVADRICEEDAAINRSIGEHGLGLVEAIARERHGAPVRVLTHCNAGALATLEWGTATAPVFLGHSRGLALKVWVSETRPRLQGANLTAWEMATRGIDHAIVPDGASAHLMQRGEVDIVFVGADRVTRTGDVCNKIGTYCKALAAREHGVPFYAAVPGPTIDWRMRDGVAEIPIEQRSADEVLFVRGRTRDGTDAEVRIAPPASPAVNFAFDVTPARFVSGLVTERGVAPASEAGLVRLFPGHGGVA